MQNFDRTVWGNYNTDFYSSSGYTNSTQSGGNKATHDTVSSGPNPNNGDKHSPNPYSYAVRHWQNDSNQVCRSKNPISGNSFVQTGCIEDIAALVGFSYENDRAYEQALKKLNEKVRGGTDVSTDVAQGKQTKDMFSARKQIDHFLSKRGKGMINIVSSYYLMYKFGFLPLIADLYGVIEESTNFVLNKIQRYSAGASIPVTPTQETSVTLVANGSRQVYVQRGGKASCRICVACEIPPTSWDAKRFTSMNPIGIAWEVLPYSFVVDWFYDIGNMLRGLETALLYNQYFRSGYISTLNVGKGSANMTYELHSPFEDTYFAGSGWHKETLFTRSVLSHYPVPNLPSLNFDLGSGQMSSAAGVMGQFTGRGGGVRK
jgi:hypothetical protein